MTYRKLSMAEISPSLPLINLSTNGLTDQLKTQIGRKDVRKKKANYMLLTKTLFFFNIFIGV